MDNGRKAAQEGYAESSGDTGNGANGKRRLLGGRGAARVPDLESRRREALRRGRNPVRRALIFLQRISPLLIIAAVAAALYLNATALNAFLLALNFVWQLAFGILVTLLQFVAIFWFMSRSRVERIRPEDPKVITFDDYWGQANLKNLVRQWLGLLSDREAFVRMGGRYINGLLLYGEPGTGKTMLAKAMAGEAGVAFISMEGSGFRNMFWGVDTLKMMWFVRKARKLARRYGAAIAYIDEIDAVGASRGGVMGGRGGPGGGGMGGMGGMLGMGGSGALTRLLYEMDGIGIRTRTEKLRAKAAKLFRRKPPQRSWHVLFMGSTNRPDVLDPALVRPGRFDQLIQVNPPDKAGRREIVQGYLRTVQHDGSVDVEAIVGDTSKSTPAQIMAALTKDAVRIALFAGRTVVTQKDIEQAFLQQWMGIENPIEEMAPDQRRQIAVHEAGHAVAQHFLLPDQRIVHLTIVARAQSLGFMLPLDQVEMYSYPLRRVVADIMVGMAGHVATRIVFGEDWTGAYSDFQQVRAHLRHLQSLGYFGPPIFEPGADAKQDKVLADFWRDLEHRVETLLRSHCSVLITLADALLKRSSLSSDEVLAILEPPAVPAPGPDGDGAQPAALPVHAPSCTEMDLITAQ
ncbi:MAG TPA: AAA family ATPase [Spirochaetia bacterium]|nr:AAA family ATPase [Spirochaetia bacterium]